MSNRLFLLPGLFALATIALMAASDTTTSTFASFNDRSTGVTAQVKAGEWLARLTIVKQTTPGSSAVSFPFTISPTVTGCGSFSLDNSLSTTGVLDQQVCLNVYAGTYTIDENVPANWTVGSINCTGNATNESVNLANGTATVQLAGGEDVTCTFTNVMSVGTITIVKATNPTLSATAFAFTDDIPDCAIGTLDTDASGTNPPSRTCSGVPVGTYTVDEGAVTDWFVSSIVCVETGGTSNSTVVLGTGIATIRLEANETVTCTYTNQGPLTVELTSTEDTWIDSRSPVLGIGENHEDDTHGNENVMHVEGLDVLGVLGDEFNSLVKFNVSSIPAGSTILDADLRLCNTRTLLSASIGHQVRFALQSWTEALASWDTFVDPPGAESEASGAFTLSITLLTPACYTVAVDAHVQRWINGEANNGWYIRNAIVGALIQYATSENGDTTIRPRLTVRYKVAPPP